MSSQSSESTVFSETLGMLRAYNRAEQLLFQDPPADVSHIWSLTISRK